MIEKLKLLIDVQLADISRNLTFRPILRLFNEPYLKIGKFWNWKLFVVKCPMSKKEKKNQILAIWVILNAE